MRSAKKIGLLLAIITAPGAALLSCGDAIDQMQGFVENKPPVLTSEPTCTAKADANGNLPDTSNLVGNAVFTITIEASDPENEGLSFEFTSDQGSFSAQTDTANGSTVLFVTSDTMSANETVKVTASAVDIVGDKASRTLIIGKAKPAPQISTSTLPVSAATGASVSVTVTPDCSGTAYAAFNTVDAIPAIPQFTTGWASGSISAKSISTTAPSAAGTYYLYVVFTDALGMIAYKKSTVTVN